MKAISVTASAIHLVGFCPILGMTAMMIIPSIGRKIIQLNKFKFKAYYLS